MAQYFAPQDPRQDKYGQIGEILGHALGGLGGYVSNEYQKPQKIKQFMDAGATDAEANMLVNMPPQQQMQFFQQKMKMQQQQQENATIANIFGGGQQQPQQQPDLQSLPGGDINQRLSHLAGGRQPVPQQPAVLTPEQEQVIVQKTKGMTPQQIDEVLRSPEIPMHTKKQIYDILDKQRASEFKERAHEENKAAKDKSLTSKEKTEAYKVTAPYRAELAKEAESTDHLIDVLKQQKQLSESGKMTHSGYLEFLEKTGLDFNALKSPETEQYQALEKDFLKDLKNVFGGKVSNLEMSTFLKGIPKATNTPEGRKRITKQLDSYYKAKQLKFRTARKIIKDNGGTPPLDLQDQVVEKTRGKEEKYADQFRGGKKENGFLISELTAAHNPTGLPDGAIAKDDNGNPIARVVNGAWEPL